MPLLLHLTLASASLSDSTDHIVEQKATLAQRIGYGMAIINGGGFRPATGPPPAATAPEAALENWWQSVAHATLTAHDNAIPQCATASTPPPPTTFPLGVVSVVDFGADPTGAKDSTAALQRAMTVARTDNVTLFMPLGCYAVTDTLNATEPRNGRWQPVVVVGQTVPASWGHRPTLFLPRSTSGFGGPAPKPLLLFATNWCLEPGPAEAAAATGCASADFQEDWKSSAYQFNQVLQGVDLVLMGGNLGAIGIDMNAAQGSTLEDVAIFAPPDALAGVAGGNGGDGGFETSWGSSS